jgi:hypothetical protein
VHRLVVKEAWWQQAVSQHPLLVLQVVMTAADVSSHRFDAFWALKMLMNIVLKLHTSQPTPAASPSRL